MRLLIGYDVDTTTSAGRKRLRRMAKACEGHGQRVQYSLFECSLTKAQYEEFRHRLIGIINEEKDNLRIYHLQGAAKDFVEEYGRFQATDYGDPLIL